MILYIYYILVLDMLVFVNAI